MSDVPVIAYSGVALTAAAGYVLVTEGIGWRVLARQVLTGCRRALADLDTWMTPKWGARLPRRPRRVRKTPAAVPEVPPFLAARTAPAGMLPAPVLALAEPATPLPGAGSPVSIWANECDPARKISDEVFIYAAEAYIQRDAWRWASREAARARRIQREAAIGDHEGELLARYGASMHPAPISWQPGDPEHLRRTWAEDITGQMRAIEVA